MKKSKGNTQRHSRSQDGKQHPTRRSTRAPAPRDHRLTLAATQVVTQRPRSHHNEQEEPQSPLDTSNSPEVTSNSMEDAEVQSGSIHVEDVPENSHGNARIETGAIEGKNYISIIRLQPYRLYFSDEQAPQSNETLESISISSDTEMSEKEDIRAEKGTSITYRLNSE